MENNKYYKLKNSRYFLDKAVKEMLKYTALTSMQYLGGDFMTMLKENDWNSINEILLEAYALDREIDITSKFLKMLTRLIPFTRAFFLMCDENNDIIVENSAFYNINEQKQQDYINKFYQQDYIKYIINDTRSIVFRDTDILEEDARKQTEFYKEFLSPQDLPFGSGIVFIKNENLLGILNLFRNNEIGNFTDKELNILNIFKDHLTNIIYSLRKNSVAIDGTSNVHICELEKYNLSKRETEIIKLMLDGLSNQEISDSLVISISTVKKHIYNIFTKLGINSRLQMLKLFNIRK